MHNRKERQTRQIASHMRAQDGDMMISGYFAVFDEKYEIYPGVTESIDPRAFDQTIDDDVRALTDHDTRLVLGRTVPKTLRLRTDGKGLWGDIDINPEDSDAMNTRARCKRGDVNQASFGFDILDEEKSIDPNTGNVHYTIKAVKLYEVSVCTFPAYKSTGLQARAEREQQTRRLEIWRENMRRRLRHGA